jgi:P-type Ca2+ transporter type 2C
MVLKHKGYMSNSPIFYQFTGQEAAASLKVDPAKGLDSDDAANRLKQYGRNVLEQKKRISPFRILLEQFQDFLIIILLVAAIASIALGERVDGFLILGIVCAVAIVGFLNEYKAERTIEALKKLVALKARVLRSGEVQEVESKDLVPGDIVLLEEGQKVPADIRLLEVIGLQTIEGSLTGESLPTAKEIEPIPGEVTVGDRKNMVFSSTVVASGKGRGIVVGTGSNTEIGKIATMVEEAVDEETPMQKKLDRLGRQMGYGILAICAVVFVVIFFLDKESSALPLVRRLTFAFIAAVALAVAAIPEGLAFVVRISLALGARRMAKRNALIRKLPAVEALGSTDTICSDKTGTLTRGEMTVRELWTAEGNFSVSGSGYDTKGEFTSGNKPATTLKPLERLLQVGWLCNNTQVKDGHVIGDPTEAAMLVVAQKANQNFEQFERVGEVPFTSLRKFMTTIHKSDKGFLVSSKGATEVVLEHSTHILVNGQAEPLTSDMRKKILDQNYSLSKQALRVLAMAYKEVEAKPSEKDAETSLVFAGLQGMMDPPRTEIRETIEAVTKQAGMKVIMITGDHVETAKAVAHEIGIAGEAITGVELDQLSQGEFEAKVERIAIYARVSPEHKIRIVQALKKHGHQVAMTGDGVNDAPAIKAADIGIAMGITGTDVAKEAADVILLDDHFNTIVAAVEEGRGIFDNVRKFVNYLVSCNIAEVLLVTTGIIAFGELALTAVQLLFINIVTDGLPAIALGSDPAAKGIMNYSPKRFQSNIVNRRLWLEMFLFGTVMTILLAIQFGFNLQHGGLQHAVAAAFTATVILEMVRLVGLRSDYKISWLANPWLIVAILSSLALQALIIYSPLAVHFGAAGLTRQDWAFFALAGVILFVVMKLVRVVLLRLYPEEVTAVAA